MLAPDGAGHDLDLPVGQLVDLFRTLALPASWPEDWVTPLVGRYHAEIVGPVWLRTIGPPGLGLIGLPRWWGKEIGPDGRAVNLLKSPRGLVQTLPMRASVHASTIDHAPAVHLTYPPPSPLPWRRVTDDVRPLGDGRWLGLSVSPLPGPPLPFLLVPPHQERP